MASLVIYCVNYFSLTIQQKHVPTLSERGKRLIPRRVDPPFCRSRRPHWGTQGLPPYLWIFIGIRRLWFIWMDACFGQSFTLFREQQVWDIDSIIHMTLFVLFFSPASTHTLSWINKTIPVDDIRVETKDYLTSRYLYPILRRPLAVNTSTLLTSSVLQNHQGFVNEHFDAGIKFAKKLNKRLLETSWLPLLLTFCSFWYKDYRHRWWDEQW